MGVELDHAEPRVPPERRARARRPSTRPGTAARSAGGRARGRRRRAAARCPPACRRPVVVRPERAEHAAAARASRRAWRPGSAAEAASTAARQRPDGVRRRRRRCRPELALDVLDQSPVGEAAGRHHVGVRAVGDLRRAVAVARDDVEHRRRGSRGRGAARGSARPAAAMPLYSPLTRICAVRVAHASRCRGEMANSASSPSRPGKHDASSSSKVASGCSASRAVHAGAAPIRRDRGCWRRPPCRSCSGSDARKRYQSSP